VTNGVTTDGCTAHRLEYGVNGEVVLYVMGESWEWDGEAENCPTDYAVSYAREFQYDNAMQRYMDVELDPTDDFEPIETAWTDYDLSAGQADGDRVYGDFEVVDDEYLETMSHEPRIGFVDDPTGTPAPGYYHGDMLGTTRRTTNSAGNMVDTAAYTAFGEFLGGSADRRYGFAGAWQYQSHPATGFPYLHVGSRFSASYETPQSTSGSGTTPRPARPVRPFRSVRWSAASTRSARHPWANGPRPPG
jgi:hypothetical protein